MKLPHRIKDRPIQANLDYLVGKLKGADSDGFGFSIFGIGVRFGTNTVTFTASASSAGTAVTHGLSRTPKFLNCNQAVSTSVLIFGASSVGASTFTASAFSVAGAITGTFTFYWLAIG